MAELALLQKKEAALHKAMIAIAALFIICCAGALISKFLYSSTPGALAFVALGFLVWIAGFILMSFLYRIFMNVRAAQGMSEKDALKQWRKKYPALTMPI